MQHKFQFFCVSENCLMWRNSHRLHWCGYSQMCVKLWHCVHYWVFCPLWIIICHISSLTAWLFTLCTFVQFFPMWKSMCIFRVPASLNDLLHCTHLPFVQHLPAVNAQVSIISTNWFVAFGNLWNKKYHNDKHNFALNKHRGCWIVNWFHFVILTILWDTYFVIFSASVVVVW